MSRSSPSIFLGIFGRHPNCWAMLRCSWDSSPIFVFPFLRPSSETYSMMAMNQTKQRIDNRKIIGIRYEDLCSDPAGSSNRSMRSNNLSSCLLWNKVPFLWDAECKHPPGQKESTKHSRWIFNSVMKSHLSRYGYIWALSLVCGRKVSMNTVWAEIIQEYWLFCM